MQSESKNYWESNVSLGIFNFGSSDFKTEEVNQKERKEKMHAIVAQPSFRDRTQEFQSVADRLRKSISSGQGQNGPSSSTSRAVEKRSMVAHQSEFNRKASKIGFGIHQTSQKLSKLAKC